MVVGKVNRNGIMAVCEKCGEEVGQVSFEEARGVFIMGESILCFECDSRIADCVPIELMPPYQPGDCVTMIGRPGEGQISVAWDTPHRMAVRRES